MPSTKKSVKRVKAGTSREAAAQRRKAFIEAYITNGGNGTQAAVTAGFSAKTAGQQASELLKDPKVAAAIRTRLEEAASITGLSTERTLREVARLAYADPRKLFRSDGSPKAIHELDDDCAAMVASVEIDESGGGDAPLVVTKKIKVWDKNAALEKAMKYHGLYKKDNEQPNAELVQAVNRLTVQLDFGAVRKRMQGAST